jgi:hypothetical protein
MLNDAAPAPSIASMLPILPPQPPAPDTQAISALLNQLNPIIGGQPQSQVQAQPPVQPYGYEYNYNAYPAAPPQAQPDPYAYSAYTAATSTNAWLGASSASYAAAPPPGLTPYPGQNPDWTGASRTYEDIVRERQQGSGSGNSRGRWGKRDTSAKVCKHWLNNS